MLATRIAATLVCALSCLSFAACTTMRPVTTDPAGKQIRTSFKAGDQVRVVRKDGLKLFGAAAAALAVATPLRPGWH